MKQSIRVFPFIIFIALISVIACQHDDAVRIDEQTKSQDASLIIQMESGEHLRTTHPSVYQKLNQSSHSAKNNDGTPYSLDLNTIQIIERNTYTQYTTPVVGHVEQENYLINYMLLEFDDGDSYQFLIKYPRLTNGLDYTNAIMEAIEGATILNKTVGSSRPCLNGVPEIQNTYDVLVCTDFKCTGDAHHPYGEECDCGTIITSCQPPLRICGWETVNVWGCSGGGSQTGGDSNDGTAGGGSNDPNNDNPDDPIETIPLLDLRDANIKNKLLEYSNTTKIKNKLSDLGQKIFDPNYHLEDGAMYKREADGQYTDRPPDVLIEAGTEFIPEFKVGEVVSLHMHQQKAWDYSGDVPVLKEISPIFSKIDIHKFLKFRKFRKDTDENIPDNNDDDIVAMLASETGVYALAVGDDEKMDEAFTALGNDPEYNPTQNWLSFEKKFNMDVLDECGNDNECLVRAFIEFLKDKHEELGNQTLGIRIYEAVIFNGEITRWKRL
ncbi:hypothetical protein EZY14_004275 [Kordia sp. TARA_039_SRF]|nr:hypothetical protein EZY14_004275 [Kordia sp. TARA_039_SRF]